MALIIDQTLRPDAKDLVTSLYLNKLTSWQYIITKAPRFSQRGGGQTQFGRGV